METSFQLMITMHIHETHCPHASPLPGGELGTHSSRLPAAIQGIAEPNGTPRGHLARAPEFVQEKCLVIPEFRISLNSHTFLMSEPPSVSLL